MNAHAHNARKHAKRRAVSRFGARLNRHHLRELVETIRQGRARFLWRQSRTRCWFLVQVNGKPAVAVYSSQSGVIHTFLTLEIAKRKLTPLGIFVPEEVSLCA
jgi:hypothetical protein